MIVDMAKAQRIQWRDPFYHVIDDNGYTPRLGLARVLLTKVVELVRGRA